ncbi:MAG: lysine--tRNA ligase [Candidatus Methanoplasma sp.]|jgi:lysyl-tRNA synthetase class 1|nr:lysine--tRNA ligase [Candidatus Methanoplasma sp.]
MHWADVIADELIKSCDKPLIATGISPTGIIHVGSLREAITGESVRSAVEAKGASARLIYLIDSYDPLRRRYEFLPESFEEYPGMPISDIPCPCGKHDNYAHHFIQPFLDAAESLNVKCEIIWTHELYRQGKFEKAVDLCLRNHEEIARILREVSGKDEGKGSPPYNPRCERCGRFAAPVLETYSYPTVEYRCKCGHRGVDDIREGKGKLQWRLEWPAKWLIFGTSAEPFGKDHASAGGSYDSGKRIAREIYGIEPPYPIPYEFVQLKEGKSRKQMHKSAGGSVSGVEALGMLPPEVLNYFFLRVNPGRAIDFDSELGVLDLADEYDRMERAYFSGDFTEAEEGGVRAYEIAQHNRVPASLPFQVPCRHLVNVVQMSDSFEGAMEVIGRTEDLSKASPEDLERLRRRMDCVRYWLDGFAPESVKFKVHPQMPEGLSLSAEEKAFFKDLSGRVGGMEWNPESIGSAISEAGKASPIGSKGAYKAIYSVLIGKASGPRLGPFLAGMDRAFVEERLRRASE